MKNFLSILLITCGFISGETCIFAGPKKKKSATKNKKNQENKWNSLEQEIRTSYLTALCSKHIGNHVFSTEEVFTMSGTSTLEKFQYNFNEAVRRLYQEGVVVAQHYCAYHSDFVEKAKLCAQSMQNFKITNNSNFLALMEDSITSANDFQELLWEDLTSFILNSTVQLSKKESPDKLAKVKLSEKDLAKHKHGGKSFLTFLKFHKEQQDFQMTKRCILMSSISSLDSYFKNFSRNSTTEVFGEKRWNFIRETHQYNQIIDTNLWKEYQISVDALSEKLWKIADTETREYMNITRAEAEQKAEKIAEQRHKKPLDTMEKLSAKISNMKISEASEISCNDTDWDEENQELDFLLENQKKVCAERVENMIKNLGVHCMQKRAANEGFIPVPLKKSASMEKMMDHVSKHLIPIETYEMMEAAGGIVPGAALEQLRTIQSFWEYLQNPDVSSCSAYILPKDVSLDEFVEEFFNTVTNVHEEQGSFTATTGSYSVIEFLKVRGEHNIELRYRKGTSTRLRGGVDKTFYPLLD